MYVLSISSVSEVQMVHNFFPLLCPTQPPMDFDSDLPARIHQFIIIIYPPPEQPDISSVDDKSIGGVATGPARYTPGPVRYK
ncbi:hypothetical protein GWI33_001286 [Rhynchophorus ferrugineus]|uniref:Uncharacterized protein n=1 Tax=Rhynchophorus ferrugineus TaxID=354439 RepID=A0A834LXF7_RHYFE|nr:hypothetical protein GWI33_001286 [Rhynchophorus ferrugineus]